LHTIRNGDIFGLLIFAFPVYVSPAKFTLIINLRNFFSYALTTLKLHGANFIREQDINPWRQYFPRLPRRSEKKEPIFIDGWLIVYSEGLVLRVRPTVSACASINKTMPVCSECVVNIYALQNGHAVETVSTHPAIPRAQIPLPTRRINAIHRANNGPQVVVKFYVFAFNQ